MDLSPWLYLPTDDYDRELVQDQMKLKSVEGIGYCGWYEEATIDPGEIIGHSPGATAQAVSQEHQEVLLEGLGLTWEEYQKL